jgi:peptidoglycan/LPS O-acetylase OafA/YrhL
MTDAAFPCRFQGEGWLNSKNLGSASIIAEPLIRPYMPELDSVRGLAILLVLLLHGTAWPLHSHLSSFGLWFLTVSQHGGVGVNLFFVLSGFLITGILIDSKNDRDYYWRFYFRRALRIFPAFYVTLLILFAGGWLSLRFAALSSIFLANLTPLFGVPLQYGPLWSLAVEEHFYLLLPFAVRRFSSQGIGLAASLTVAASPLLREIAYLSGHYSGTTFLYTWFNLDGLAMGAILALWLRQPRFQRRQLAYVALPLLAAGSAACFGVSSYPGIEAGLLMTVRDMGCAGWLSCMLLLGTSRWKFLADVPALRFLGFISYGVYLVHVLAFGIGEKVLSSQYEILISNGFATSAMLLRLLAGTSIAIVIAYLSRRSLEERFLRMGVSSIRRNVRMQTEPAAANA